MSPPTRYYPTKEGGQLTWGQGGGMETSLVVIERQYNGMTIGQREADGYFNATAMCHATGRRLDNYIRPQTTYEFVKVLSKSLRCEEIELIQTFRGAPETGEGTWVHEDIAIDLAMWISSEFKLRVIQ